MTKIELLAPAGNRDAFYQAVNNGADAVYMGGLNFSARAFAENFSHDDFKELVDYAHLRNVKIYVTLNTLLTDFEFEKACEDVRFYYENNVDAILIQDLGLFYWIKSNLPDMEVHASTQMHIHNLEGVKNCRKLGFNRVVLARESTLEFIKEASRQDIEIETFVHGALCVSYSGQCLLSSSNKNRSANKGMCAQCCRLRYELLDGDNKHIDTDTDYLLSPKDMFLLDDIPDLIKAGVSSLKIEGRMKSSAYVGYVTSCYRKAIDAYYEGKTSHLSKEDMNHLKVLFNRGFSNTYLHDTKEDLFHQSMPNHQGIVIGEVMGSNGKRVSIKLSNELNQFDGVRIYSKKFDDGFIVNKLYVKNRLVSKAYRNELIELESLHPFKKGDQLLKTVDYLFEKEINSSLNKYLPLSLKAKFKVGEPVKIETDEFVYISDTIPEKAFNAPLNEESISKQFAKLKNTPYYLKSMEIETDNVFLRLCDLNNIRNKFIEAYNSYRLHQFAHKGKEMHLEFSDLTDETSCEDLNLNDLIQKRACFHPVINIHSDYKKGNFHIVSENGGLFLKGEKLASYTLNISNSHTYEFFKRLGFGFITLSSELNRVQIDEMIKNYKERTGCKMNPYILDGNKRTLMYIRNNPFKDYKNAKYLKNDDCCLEIIKHEEYTELIENYHSDGTLNGLNRFTID